MLIITFHSVRISLSSFDKLSFLSLGVEGADLQGVADMSRHLPSCLDMLLPNATLR